MLRFTDPNITPPGGNFVYKQAETSWEFKDPSLNRLIKQVKVHRIANSIPIGVETNQEIEDASCREILEKYPNYSGCTDQNNTKIGNQSIGLSEVISWGQAMIQLGINGFAPPEEAERRASICAVCPKNKAVQGCFGCRGATAIMDKLRGSRRTKYDSRLEVCEACSCVIRSLVHFPDEAIDKSHSDDLPYAPTCWIPPLKEKLRG